MSANSDWKAELAELLKVHNGVHARKRKVVAYRTKELRAQGLFRCIKTLRALGCEVGPRSLRNRHVQRLVDYWTAKPSFAEYCRSCGLKVERRSPAYIQQHLSFLRVLCVWIGKPGMIGPATDFVDDPSLVKRHYAATEPHGWTDNGIDVEAMLAKVTAQDRHVGVQLALLVAFGLRRKEAVMFVPKNAEVPAHALPAEHANERYLQFVRVKRGTKGGRLRFVAVRTEFQRQTLEKARELAGSGHVGKPGLSLEQSLDKFSNTLRAVGVTKRQLGVTPHGTRHQFAADLFVNIAELPPPVLGGLPSEEIMRQAYLEVARQLGHNRPQISKAYLGAPGRQLDAGT